MWGKERKFIRKISGLQRNPWKVPRNFLPRELISKHKLRHNKLPFGFKKFETNECSKLVLFKFFIHFQTIMFKIYETASNFRAKNPSPHLQSCSGAFLSTSMWENLLCSFVNGGRGFLLHFGRFKDHNFGMRACNLKNSWKLHTVSKYYEQDCLKI